MNYEEEARERAQVLTYFFSRRDDVGHCNVIGFKRSAKS